MEVVEKHKVGPDGIRRDGIGADPVTPLDMQTYEYGMEAVQALSVPKLFRSSHTDERLFFATFDGTGNDMVKDPEHSTNIGEMAYQVEGLKQRSTAIGGRYISGPGTQGSALVRTADGILGYSYDRRVEDMYESFCWQAARWKRDNPDADIRVFATGFSRGAEQALGFMRMVDERGIQDPSRAVRVRHLTGPDTIRYVPPPIVPPGRVLQATVLFDPVGTGHPREHDRRLPKSVVTAFVIVARDERRNAFASTQVVPQGLSADGRTLGITVAGAHSDIGGSYHLNGLSILNGNLAKDVINSMSDTHLLDKVAVPQDERMFVKHRSEEHMFLYRTTHFDKNGSRDSMGAQISPPHCRMVEACAPPEPFDTSLEGLAGPRHRVIVGDVPSLDFASTEQRVAPDPAVALGHGATVNPPASSMARGNRAADDLEKETRVDFRNFDPERRNSIGNIPVPATFHHDVDSTRSSSLQAIGRSPSPDPVQERTLMRETQLINDRVRVELGQTLEAGSEQGISSLSDRPDKSDPKRQTNVTDIRAQEQRRAHAHDEAMADVGHVAAQRSEPSSAPARPEPATRADAATHAAETHAAHAPHRPSGMSPGAAAPPSPSHAEDHNASLVRSDENGRKAQPVSETSKSPGLVRRSFANEEPEQPSHSRYKANDPRNEHHRDHALYTSINMQVSEMHAREGIDVTREQMDRLSASLLVQAKANGIRSVTDVEFGNRNGQRTSHVLISEAFRGSTEDPRCNRVGLDAAHAIKIPVETTSQQLDAVNQDLDNRMQQRHAMQQNQQQGVSM